MYIKFKNIYFINKKKTILLIKIQHIKLNNKLKNKNIIKDMDDIY